MGGGGHDSPPRDPKRESTGKLVIRVQQRLGHLIFNPHVSSLEFEKIIAVI